MAFVGMDVLGRKKLYNSSVLEPCYFPFYQKDWE